MLSFFLYYSLLPSYPMKNYMRHMLLIVFLVTYQVEGSIPTEVYLNLQGSIQNFTQIGMIQYSAYSNEILYVSAQWNSSGNAVKKFNISVHPPILLHTYSNPNGLTVPLSNKMVQIDYANASYLVLYQYQSACYYLYLQNSYYIGSWYLSPTSQLIYSKVNSVVYSILGGGQLTSFPAYQIVHGNIHSITVFQYINIDCSMRLSLDQTLLAVGAYTANFIKVYDTTTTFLVFYWTSPIANNSNFVFKNDLTLLLMNQQYLYIYMVPIKVSTNTVRPYSNYTQFTPIDRSIIHYAPMNMKYLVSDNKLLIIASNPLNLSVIFLFFFDFINLTPQPIQLFGSQGLAYAEIGPNTTQSRYYIGYGSTLDAYIRVLLSNANTTNNASNGNITNSINTTNVTNLINITNLIQIAYYESFLFQLFKTLIDYTIKSQVFAQVNLIPASRKVLKPIFVYFSNFDDLWLYNYHNRQYDSVINYLFETITNLQTQKWSILPFTRIWGQLFGVNVNQLKKQLDYKKKYSSIRFLNIQSNGNGFILSTLDYFTSNIFFTFAIYFLFRQLFFLLYKNPLSKLFRSYSFFSLMIILILDGNLQYFIYVFGFDMKYLFSYQVYNKFCMILTLILNFLLILCAVSIFWMIRYFCIKKQKYLFQNIKVNFNSTWYLCMQFGIRNIVLGFSHIYIISKQQASNLKLLLFIQIIFFAYNVKLSANRFSISLVLKLRQWFIIIGAFLRVLLIILMILSIEADNRVISFNDQLNYTQFSQINIIIIIVYIFVGCFSIIYETIQLSLQIKDSINIPNNNNQKSLINPKIKSSKFSYLNSNNLIGKDSNNLARGSRRQQRIILSLQKKDDIQIQKLNYQHLWLGYLQKKLLRINDPIQIKNKGLAIQKYSFLKNRKKRRQSNQPKMSFQISRINNSKNFNRQNSQQKVQKIESDQQIEIKKLKQIIISKQRLKSNFQIQNE